jgi:hypothetical protein
MPKRPGRPRLDESSEESSARVSLTLSARDYDAIHAQASRDRVSVPEAIRPALRVRRARERHTRYERRNVCSAEERLVALVIATIAVVISGANLYRTILYVSDRLQIVALGGVDAVLPREEQDRIDMNVAIVNSGTREASVLEAEIVALHNERDGRTAWMRLFPPEGEGFQPIALKPGEIKIVPLVTAQYASKFFLNPRRIGFATRSRRARSLREPHAPRCRRWLI